MKNPPVKNHFFNCRLHQTAPPKSLDTHFFLQLLRILELFLTYVLPLYLLKKCADRLALFILYPL